MSEIKVESMKKRKPVMVMKMLSTQIMVINHEMDGTTTNI